LSGACRCAPRSNSDGQPAHVIEILGVCRPVVASGSAEARVAAIAVIAALALRLGRAA